MHVVGSQLIVPRRGGLLLPSHFMLYSLIRSSRGIQHDDRLVVMKQGFRCILVVDQCTDEFRGGFRIELVKIGEMMEEEYVLISSVAWNIRHMMLVVNAYESDAIRHVRLPC